MDEETARRFVSDWIPRLEKSTQALYGAINASQIVIQGCFDNAHSGTNHIQRDAILRVCQAAHCFQENFDRRCNDLEFHIAASIELDDLRRRIRNLSLRACGLLTSTVNRRSTFSDMQPELKAERRAV